jgi:cytoskeletal protein CcmA (bactofilin family)
LILFLPIVDIGVQDVYSGSYCLSGCIDGEVSRWREMLIPFLLKGGFMWNITKPMGDSDQSTDQVSVSAPEESGSSERRSDLRRTNPGQSTLIGASIKIKGQISGNEDLIVDGLVEGKIELKNHHLIVGPAGRVKADVSARRVTLRGEIRGNVKGHEMVHIDKTGKMIGDLVTPKIIVEEGAVFTGGIQMGDTQTAEKHSSSNRKKESHAAGTVSENPVKA